MIKPGKRILLVFPELPSKAFWSFSRSLKLMEKAFIPPLGLLTVAALLPEDYEVRLIDLNVEQLNDQDIQWADAVFVSAMIVQRESFRRVVDRVCWFGIPVVAGGPYPSTCYKEIVGVSHFILGEAENVLDVFMADFKQSRARKAYARPVKQKEYDDLRRFFGDDADVVLAKERADPSRSPIPRFDLLNISRYFVMPVQFSRGCPHTCEFCDIWRRLGNKPRLKSPARIIAELDELLRLGWRKGKNVFLVDDNFIGNKARTKELLRKIVEWQKANRYPFHFITEATLLLAEDEELLGLMREAGFDEVFIGIESPSKASLEGTGKIINTRGSLTEKVEKIQSYGIEIEAGFIIGFDQDPSDIAELMIAMIQESGIPMAMVGLLTVGPDTGLYERLESEGRLLRMTSGNSTYELSLDFIPRRPQEEVIEAYKRVLDAIYPADLKSYFERCKVLRKRWVKNPHLSGCPSWQEIKAFLKSLSFILTKAYGLNYLRFLVSTLFIKPSFFTKAATAGIRGCHLAETTQAVLRNETG